VLVYDVLGMDRGTAYYFDVVQNSHDRRNFEYKFTGDPYVADKCVDAIIHLGDARYNRLEGEVQVVLLLSDVLAEDLSALARNVSAASLTRLALKLPAADAPKIPDRGDRFLSLLKDQLDPLYDETLTRRRDDSPGTRERVRAIVEEIGRLELPSPVLEKDALRWFPARPYVAGETDPVLREAFDLAMVRRSRSLILASLEGAVLDATPHVRQAAVQGLKTLGHAEAVPALAERVPDESHPWVRAEIAEFFGAMGGPEAAAALLPMLDDADGSVRFKARSALTRIAGQDLGGERKAWSSWVESRFPASTAASAAPPDADRAGR
jgi:hypothetical protein